MLRGDANDRVTLVKQNGEVFKEEIPAMVQRRMIFIEDEKLPIEPGDRILRKLPSGLSEEYIVDDPGFFDVAGVPAHFQIKCHRADAKPKEPQQIINNVQGQNARVNMGSADYSVNTAVSGRSDNVFEGLRDQLRNSDVPDEDAKNIRSAIDDMENKVGEQDFQSSYKNFMETAADHAAVFGPLLAKVSSFL